ncbi:MAG: anti-sigma factor domain-containing protein, partial [Clostridiales bacterium]|nr:anti-sigma factor domain-containing protein [Clostridiales bacterium]
MKGIIIEKSIFHTLILTPTGEYKKINRVIKREIGEEIELENRRFALKHVIAVAAMFMLFVFSSLYYDMRFNKEVFAFVTVDINPSIEFEINQHNYVISATAFNDDAKKVLENMSYRFRKIDEVASRFTKKAVELQFLDGVNDHIFLSVISNNGMGDNDLTVMIERIVNVQSATLEEENIEAFVGVLQLTIESRNLAREYGVSATTLELSKEITGVNKQGVVIINLEELEDMSDEALDRIIDTINKRCENKDADFGDSEENEEDDDKKGEEDEDGDDDDQDENEEKDDDDDQDENEEKDDDDDQDENEEQEDGDDQDEN